MTDFSSLRSTVPNYPSPHPPLVKYFNKTRRYLQLLVIHDIIAWEFSYHIWLKFLISQGAIIFMNPRSTLWLCYLTVISTLLILVQQGSILNLVWHLVSSSSASSPKNQQPHLTETSKISSLKTQLSMQSVWVKHFPFLPPPSKNEKRRLMLLPSDSRQFPSSKLRQEKTEILQLRIQFILS